MGYDHARFARLVSTNVEVKDPRLSYPMVRLYSSGHVGLRTVGGTAGILFFLGISAGKITYASNTTLFEGGSVTGDVLELKCNTIDSYPFVRLSGDGAIYLMGKQQIDLGINNVLGGRFKLGGDDAGGSLHLKETTTPTALADYGALYTKADNHLYFQDGAGAEHDMGSP